MSAHRNPAASLALEHGEDLGDPDVWGEVLDAARSFVARVATSTRPATSSSRWARLPARRLEDLVSQLDDKTIPTCAPLRSLPPTCAPDCAAPCMVRPGGLAHVHGSTKWLALMSAPTTNRGARLRGAHLVSGRLGVERPFTHVRRYPSGSETMRREFPFCGADLSWPDVVVLVAPGADPRALSAELVALSGELLDHGRRLLEQAGLTDARDPCPRPGTFNHERYRRIIHTEALSAARAGARWLGEGEEPECDPTPLTWPPAWWDEGECESVEREDRRACGV